MSISKKIFKTAPTAGLFCAALAFGAAATSPAPFIRISSFQDLLKIGNDPMYSLRGIYHLTNDIDASASKTMHGGAGFPPIGLYPEPPSSPAAFTGAFDGKGYVIKNLYINRPEQDYVGLFAKLGCADGINGVQCGEIKDLGVEIDTVVGRSKVGGLVGHIDGEYASAEYKLSSSSSKISNCYVTGFVKGNSEVGGLAGFNSGAISDSYSAATVRGVWTYPVPSDDHAGGLVGVNAGKIHRCWATGNVEAWGHIEVAGGLAGSNGINGRITESYATGKAESFGTAGGLVGLNDGHIGDCYARGNAKTQGWHGGGCHPDENGLTACYQLAFLGKQHIGGLVGHNRATISNCYATGSAVGTVGPTSYDDPLFHAGGLVGYDGDIPSVSSTYPSVISSYWDVNASGIDSSAGGEGKDFMRMKVQSTFAGWDFADIWRINGWPDCVLETPACIVETWPGYSPSFTYPYFQYQSGSPEVSSVAGGRPSFARDRASSSMPVVSVKGRTLSVKLQSLSAVGVENFQPLQVRMIDMRGRTISTFNTARINGDSFSLSKIPAGRYIVDVRRSGARLGSASIMVK